MFSPLYLAYHTSLYVKFDLLDSTTYEINEYVDIEELAETTAIYRKAALLFLAGVDL